MVYQVSRWLDGLPKVRNRFLIDDLQRGDRTQNFAVPLLAEVEGNHLQLTHRLERAPIGDVCFVDV